MFGLWKQLYYILPLSELIDLYGKNFPNEPQIWNFHSLIFDNPQILSSISVSLHNLSELLGSPQIYQE